MTEQVRLNCLDASYKEISKPTYFGCSSQSIYLEVCHEKIRSIYPSSNPPVVILDITLIIQPPNWLQNSSLSSNNKKNSFLAKRYLKKNEVT